MFVGRLLPREEPAAPDIDRSFGDGRECLPGFCQERWRPSRGATSATPPRHTCTHISTVLASRILESFRADSLPSRKLCRSWRRLQELPRGPSAAGEEAEGADERGRRHNAQEGFRATQKRSYVKVVLCSDGTQTDAVGRSRRFPVHRFGIRPCLHTTAPVLLWEVCETAGVSQNVSLACEPIAGKVSEEPGGRRPHVRTDRGLDGAGSSTPRLDSRVL